VLFEEAAIGSLEKRDGRRISTLNKADATRRAVLAERVK